MREYTIPYHLTTSQYKIPEDHNCSPEERHFLYAIHEGDLQKVKSLMDKACSNIDIECPDDHQYTPLSLAVIMGHLEIVRFLLDRGANRDYRRPYQWCKDAPLHLACRYGHLKIIELLLERGSDIEDKGTWTPLGQAIHDGNIEMVQLLLNHGADINTKADINPPLARVIEPTRAVESTKEDILQLLLQKPGADVDNCVGRDGKSLLSLAAHAHEVGMIKLLLDAGARIKNHPTNRLTSPLTWAIQGIYSMTQERVGITLKTAKLLLDRGANLEHQDNDGITPLGWACKGDRRDVQIVGFLLDQGANLEHQDNDGITPLLGWACLKKEEHESWYGAEKANQAVEIIRLLLDRGANREHQDKDGVTPLGMACKVGQDVEVIGFLLDHGANLKHQDNGGFTPLGRECLAGQDVKIIKFLLDQGSNLEHQDNDGVTPLGRACQASQSYCEGEKYLAIVKCLVNKGANVNHRDNYGRTPLVLACSNISSCWPLSLQALELKRIIIQLLKHGAQRDPHDEVGRKHLSEALFLQHSTPNFEYMIRPLLDQGADIEVTDSNGNTPLYMACSNSYYGIVTILVERGADLDHKNNDGITPLGKVCLKGRNYQGLFDYLLDKGANVNHRDNHGRTPLVLACSNSLSCQWLDAAVSDLIKMITKLLCHGAERDPHDEDGRKHLGEALILAASSNVEVFGDVDMVKSLLDQGADMEVTDSKGNTPLSIACLRCNVDMVRILLERGANTEHQNRDGRTPLFLACTGFVKSNQRNNVHFARAGSLESSDGNDGSDADDAHDDDNEEANEYDYDLEEDEEEEENDDHVEDEDDDDLEEGGENDDNYDYAEEKKSVHPWQIVQLLVERGANIEHQDSSGRTPLGFALSEECAGLNSNIVFLLVRAMAQGSCDSQLTQLSQHYLSTQPPPKRHKKS